MYRVLTENINFHQIEAEMIALGLDWTAIEASGSWNGIREKSLIIEIDGYPYERVLALANRILDFNNQKAVFIQEVPSRLYLVTQTPQGEETEKSDEIYA